MPTTTPQKYILFGELLLQLGIITPTQLRHALELQQGSGRKIGEVLLSINAISPAQLARTLALQLNLPYIELDRYKPSPDAVKLISRASAERLNAVPLALDSENFLLVAMSDPLNLPKQDEVRILTGHEIKIAVSSSQDISKNLPRIYDLQTHLEGAVTDAQNMTADNFTPLTATTAQANPDDAPLIELVNDLIQQAVRENASDIHIEAYEKMSRIRFRVDGYLYSAFEYPASLHPSITARVKIMSGMDIAEKRRPQDGRILTRVDNRRIDMRVSALPTMNGEKIVLRILDQDNSFVELGKLGLDHDDLEKIETFCEMPWGILLATGPTGSGKSTTLYSMLKRISRPDINIITVEDPVEFYIPGINQVQVNEKAGLTFETALRSILRQDPDKIMVGEIRDTNTAQIAIRAALTGHFVLSTLHTNDAPGAATRLIDMGIPPFLVAAALSGVAAQRLIRCLCPFCKREYEIDSDTCEILGVDFGTKAFRASGCQKCRGGYRGRRAIYEIMILDDELREMILANTDTISLREAAVKRGMKTLRQSGINTALAGFTSLEEVMSATL